MTTLTIEIADADAKLVIDLLKKIGAKVKKQPSIKIPNAETIKAFQEAGYGKVTKFKNAKSAIEHLQKL